MFIIRSRIHESQLMRNHLNFPQQYDKRQTRVEEIEKCIDEGLDLIYHCSRKIMRDGEDIFEVI